MEFCHSQVLFCGDDGLPIEFNIQNTVDKDALKAIIEHGGGMCTYSDDAIYLVSSGTKVVNVCSSKSLISTKYVFDCVRQNVLLDMNSNDYRIEINVLETSDLSDNSADLIENDPSHKHQIDLDNSNLSASNLDVYSNHAFDFQENENKINIVISNEEVNPGSINQEIPLQSHQIGERSISAVSDSLSLDFQENKNQSKIVISNNEVNPSSVNQEIPLQSHQVGETVSDSLKFDSQENGNESNIAIPYIELNPGHINQEIPLQLHEIGEGSVSAVSDSLSLDDSVDVGRNVLGNQMENVNLQNQNVDVSAKTSPVSAVIVSSSQPNEGDADDFDNDVLSRIQVKPIEKDDDCLSQSYTVSSSADAQVSPKEPAHNTSAEIFCGSSAAPDSASQTSERQQYIRDLEKEIEKILQKPSPKSIQDKIVLVKYICIVKKLAPAKVLQTLQNLSS